MPYDAIRKTLVEKGQAIFHAPKCFVRFTGDAVADTVLNDLERYPHAFVIACIMDRQVTAERAWRIPIRLAERLGSFDFRALRSLSLQKLQSLMSSPEPLHRFPSVMGRNIFEAVQLISDRYKGNAARIWSEQPSSAEVVFRFLEFRGAGPKIATMATNILAREFKIPLSDYYSIDVSVDVQVRRVFERLGLVEVGAPLESLVYRARALSPHFPGLLDFPAWEIGRNWCRPRTPLCTECYMRPHCPTARQKK